MHFPGSGHHDHHLLLLLLLGYTSACISVDAAHPAHLAGTCRVR
jgi:hypothetical protein